MRISEACRLFRKEKKKKKKKKKKNKQSTSDWPKIWAFSIPIYGN